VLRVLNRHCVCTAADARERFLIHRAKEGAARNTLLRIANQLLVIARYIDVTSEKAVTAHDLEIAAGRWVRYQQRRGGVHGPRWSPTLFLHTATQWLRFLGLLQEPEHRPSGFVDLINDFANHMRDERGLSEVTIHNRCGHVGKFLCEVLWQNRSFAELSIKDVDVFLDRKGHERKQALNVTEKDNAYCLSRILGRVAQRDLDSASD
jgi:integrase/recombinase XerD